LKRLISLKSYSVKNKNLFQDLDLITLWKYQICTPDSWALEWFIFQLPLASNWASFAFPKCP